MMLDLTEEETDALARLLSRTIDDDRYPLSPRIHTLNTVLAKIRPEPAREPLPPLKIGNRDRRLSENPQLPLFARRPPGCGYVSTGGGARCSQRLWAAEV